MKIYLQSFFSLLLLLFGITACSSSQNTVLLPLENNNINSYIIAQKKLSRDAPDDPLPYYNLARAYVKRQSYNEAAQNIRRATHLEPLNADFLELLGLILFDQGRYSEALNELNSALKIQPERTSVYLKLALNYEQMGEYSRAIASLEEALQQDRRYVEGLYHLARLQLKQNEPDNALQSLNLLLKLESENPEALLLRIQIHRQQGNYYLAKTLSKQQLLKRPTPEVRKELLKILFLQQQWAEALQLIHKLEQQGAIHPEERLIQAFILMSRKENEAARKILIQVLDTDPLNTDAMLAVANLYIQEGQMDSALIWLNRSIETDNSIARAHFLKASLLFKEGSWLQGDLSLQRALELNKNPLPFQILNLRRHLMKRDYLFVKAELLNLLTLHPLNPEVLQLQASFHIAVKEYALAEKVLRQALVAQKSDLLRFSLARVLYLQERYSSVLPITQKLVELHPHSWESVYLHALTLNHMERPEQALAFATPFLKQKMSRGYAHRLIGDLYRYQGKEKVAQSVYQDGLERFPGHVDLLEALSASYIATEDWEKAYNLLVFAVEQNTLFQSTFLDRLTHVLQKQGKKKEYFKTLRKYNELNEPIATGAQWSTGEMFLFPVALPTLGYDAIAPTLLPQ